MGNKAVKCVGDDKQQARELDTTIQMLQRMEPPVQVLVLEYATPLNKLKMVTHSKALRQYMREAGIWERWMAHDFHKHRFRISKSWFDMMHDRYTGPEIKMRKLYIAMTVVNLTPATDDIILMPSPSEKDLSGRLHLKLITVDGYKQAAVFTLHSDSDKTLQLLYTLRGNMIKHIVGSHSYIDEETTHGFTIRQQGGGSSLWLFVVYECIVKDWVILVNDPESNTKTYILAAPVGCANCSSPAEQQCNACKSVRYCSVECQTEHWDAVHSEMCGQ